METNIEAYKQIIEIRRILKEVQQLSWDINNLDKRYPLDSVSEKDLPAVLQVFRGLKDRLANILIEVRGEEPF